MVFGRFAERFRRALAIAATVVISRTLQKFNEPLQVGYLRFQLSDELFLHFQRIHQLTDGLIHLLS